MKKKLSEMSLKELWQMFSIFLVEHQEQWDKWYKDELVSNGYSCTSENEKRMSFQLGYTENGFAEKVYHLHLRYSGDNDERYFRDYLRDYPLAAKQYEELKLSLWKKYEHDRDGYTNAKSEFIAKHTSNAKKEPEQQEY